MSESDLHFVDGPFRSDYVADWVAVIEQAYPDNLRSQDRAAWLILNALRRHGKLIVCFEGSSLDRAIGLVAYCEGDDGNRFDVIDLAVLPSHQRQGIGTFLLERVKAKARGKATIFADMVLATAVKSFRNAGFQGLGRLKGNTVAYTFRWCDPPLPKKTRARKSAKPKPRRGGTRSKTDG